MARRSIALLLAAGALAAPATAHASEVTISSTAGTAAEEFIYFKASTGERNRVQVRLGKKSTTIVDRGARRLVAGRDLAFGRCRQSGRQSVVCPSFGMVIRLRDGDNTLSFTPDVAGSKKTVTDPLDIAEDESDSEGALEEFALITAGAGDDRVTGSRYDDTIRLGPGRNEARGRAGKDRFEITPDAHPDSVRGDGGTDTVDFRAGAKTPVTIDLAAGSASAAGADNRFTGIERAHGGDGKDTLLGSPRADALYGEGGFDRIDGRGGNDLLDGEATFGDVASANELTGGEGDDVLDASYPERAPTSRVDCGPGNDRETGEVDDRVLGCERAGFRFPPTEFSLESDFFDVTVPIAPVGRGPDGAPTYDVPCPSAGEVFGPCTGTVRLERPPVASSAAPTVLGSGAFSIEAGRRANVAVDLNAAGRAALAAGEAVAVHVSGSQAVLVGEGDPPPFDFGWQQQPLGGP